MPLEFLVPAFLAGVAAVVIPVVLHLTRKQRARVVDFPSLLFLEQVPFQEESRRRIQHWFLLLLRALAVALLAVAFARPFFRGAAEGITPASGPREVVLLLDRSWSMEYQGNWEKAKEEARKVVQGLGPLDRGSLILFAREAVLAVRSSADRNQLLAALDEADLSAEGTVYGPALKLAQSILEDSDLGGRELVLIGDLQRRGWRGDEGIRLPAGTVVQPVPLATPPSANRAVADVQLIRTEADGGIRAAPVARITRVRGEGEESAVAVLEVDGKEVQRRTVNLPAEGAVAVSFEPVPVREGGLPGVVRLLAPDGLPTDDRRFFVLKSGGGVGVLVVGGAEGRGGSAFFLREALAVAGGGVFRVTLRPGHLSLAGALEGVDVVVLLDRPVLDAAEAAALRSFVEAGGGLLVATGEDFRWPETGEEVLGGRLAAPPEGRGASETRVGHVETAHPVFGFLRGFRGPGFSQALFLRRREFAPAARSGAQVLARYEDGLPALAENPLGKGRVLIWTSTLDTFWNDLARQVVYVPFVQELIRYASGLALGENLALEPGQVVDLGDRAVSFSLGLEEAVRGLLEGKSLVVVGPSGETQRLDGGDARPFVRLGREGIYQVRTAGGGGGPRAYVAVNVDLGEAELTPLDPAEVVAVLSAQADEGDRAGGGGGGGTGPRPETEEKRQSLWRYLLLAAALVLGVETVVAGRVSGFGGRRTLHAKS